MNEPHFDTSGCIIRLLLEAGADVQAKTTDHNTRLHLACRRRVSSSGAMCALLQGGANVNARGRAGHTPLHYVCNLSLVDAVKLLLRWGADGTLLDANEFTVADHVGLWEIGGGGGDRERKADDQHVRHIHDGARSSRQVVASPRLAGARPCPPEQGAVYERQPQQQWMVASSAKLARRDDVGTGVGGTEYEAPDLARLLDSVVAPDEEGVFRLVVGFL